MPSSLPVKPSFSSVVAFTLIENMGGEVLVVKGSEENIKLTTPVDVILAESILKNRIKNGNF